MWVCLYVYIYVAGLSKIIFNLFITIPFQACARENFPSKEFSYVTVLYGKFSEGLPVIIIDFVQKTSFQYMCVKIPYVAGD